MTTASGVAHPTTSDRQTTARSVAFVAGHRDPAETLGTDLAELINDPDAFATALRRGLAGLADPEYLAGEQRVAPGIGPLHGVRAPLLTALQRGFRRASRLDRATPLLFVADRLFREPELEARWFALGLLQRTLDVETERTWQLLRRAAREAGDWITVEWLAHPYAQGIASEPYRWAELEQLVYSPSRWERRLVGATIAAMTHQTGGTGHAREVPERALPILRQLMGDAEPDVQKALSWAYRSLAAVDLLATEDALRTEADRAIATSDGHRTWVIRDTLGKLEATTADELRTRLSGIRRRTGAPATSAAATTAARFDDLPQQVAAAPVATEPLAHADTPRP